MSPLLLVRAVALSLTSAAAPPPLCPAGSTAVGTAPQLYACVLRSTGRLTRIGGSTSSGESGARTQGKAGSAFVADVDGGSSVDGCTEVPGSLVVRAAQGGGDDYGDDGADGSDGAPPDAESMAALFSRLMPERVPDADAKKLFEAAAGGAGGARGNKM